MPTITDHGGRLGRVESSVHSLESRLGAVERTQAEHSSILYEIRTAVTAQSAKSASAISEWIRTGSSLVTTLAITAALLVYVAKNTAVSEFSTPMVRAQAKLDELERRLDRERVTSFMKQDRPQP